MPGAKFHFLKKGFFQANQENAANQNRKMKMSNA
jgi:hypothetical protein